MSIENSAFKTPGHEQQEQINDLNKRLQTEIVPEVSTWEVTTAKEFVDSAQALAASYDIPLGDAWQIVRAHAQVNLNFLQEHQLKQDLKAFQAAGYFE
ncbi:MAG: hypothetical protein KC877_00545 [Candidatus Kaiserbacteria bacterium]|nr:hypothetical protein [Candidatus Kaiserbacteria bacterium]MCB9816547.1 hypothetical protein [Candidatus Nomurabacteria bacterium]